MARTVRNPKIDTRSACAKLPARREPYWTVLSAGCALGYRKGAKGGTWIARFRGDDGRQHYESLGAADDASDPNGLSVFDFKQAQEKARSWFNRKAREQAGDFAPLDRPYTVVDALADYRADYLRRGGKAIDRLDWSAAAWITPELGNIELVKLTKARIVAWHYKIAETPARLRTKPGVEQKHRDADDSPDYKRRRRSTANRVLTILKGALNHAHREGKCAGDDAWRTVRAFRGADAARLRYLSDDEARRVTNACPADFRALVTSALLTGCRYGELAAMTVDDFNPDAGTLRVRQAKGGKPRHVVLTQEGREFVAQRAAGKSGSTRLFLRGNGTPWGKSEQQRPLSAACTDARIDPPVNFHGLRHTYASRLAMRGVPLAVIATQLGHADTRMVEKHYGHLSPSYVAEMIRKAFGSLGILEPSNVAPISARDRIHFAADSDCNATRRASAPAFRRHHCRALAEGQMSKTAKPTESHGQQWILDPRSPTGLRLVDLTDPPSQPTAFFDGDKFAQQFNVERRQFNTEQDWLLNTQQDWPPQKGPPDPAPPIKICRLDGMAPAEEPDPWRVSFPPFPEFSLKDRVAITRYELHLICVGSEPYASWWRPTYETPAGRMSLIISLATESERNLDRDIRDGIIRPQVLGHDKFGQRDPSSDVFDLKPASDFVRRMQLCPEERDRGYGNRFLELQAEREAQAAAPPQRQTENPHPGPKPGEKSPKELACQIALEVLDDKEKRPKRGYGWRTKIARLVNAELASRGSKYRDDSVRRIIYPTIKEWEIENPDKNPDSVSG